MNGKIADSLRILSKLSAAKVYHGVVLILSYYFSRITKKVSHRGLPLSLSIEPTTSCNLRCPECPSGLRSFTRPTGMLDIDQYYKLIDQVEPHLLYLLLYFQGEPYLHPQFLDLVSYANQKKIYTATSTNGHYLDDENAKKTVESGLDRLIVSLDGTTQDVYQQYRIGGKLEIVLEGVRKLVKWKKKLGKGPHIILQFLVVKPNEHQIADAKRLAKQLGVNEIRFKSAQIYDYEDGSPLIPENDHYSRYKQQTNGKYEIKNYHGHGCWKNWHSSVITWDGKLNPCCFDKDASYTFGNVFEQSFDEVWKGQKQSSFRQQILKNRKAVDICANCTEGLNVWR